MNIVPNKSHHNQPPYRFIANPGGNPAILPLVGAIERVPPWYLRRHGLMFVAVLLLIAATACSTPSSATDADTANSIDPTPSTRTATTATAPDPAVEPPAELIDQPLRSAPAGLPEVWLVPSLQSKEELAAYLMTDVARLDWVNPGLPEQVPPGTLIVVPPDYLARDAVTGPRALATVVPSPEMRLAVSPKAGLNAGVATVTDGSTPSR